MSTASWKTLLRIEILFALVICAISQPDCPPPYASPDGEGSCSPGPNLCQQWVGDDYYQYIPCSLQTCYLWDLFGQDGCGYQPVYNNLSCLNSSGFCNYTLGLNGYTNTWVMAPYGIESLNDYTPASHGLSIAISYIIAAVVLVCLMMLAEEHMRDYLNSPSGIFAMILKRVEDEDRRVQIARLFKAIFTINMMASFLQLLYTIIYLHNLQRDQLNCGSVGVTTGGDCYNGNMTFIPTTTPDCLDVTSGFSFWMIGVISNGWGVFFIVCFGLSSIVHISHIIQTNGKSTLVNYLIYGVVSSTNLLHSLWTTTNWDTCLAFIDDDLTALQLALFNINIYCILVIIAIIICACLLGSCGESAKKGVQVMMILVYVVMSGIGWTYRVITYINIAEHYFPKILLFHDVVYHIHILFFSFHCGF